MNRREGGGRRGEGGAFSKVRVRVAFAAVAAIVLLPPPASLSAQDVERGKALYDQWCAGCHGETGAGDGEAAAFMLPRPRDFTGAVYQIRTTASGELPTDDDLRRVIDRGMPGTTMPGWEDRLSGSERDDVVAHIKSFSRFFEDEAPQPISIGRAPRVTDEGLAEGRRLFEQDLECVRCHGDGGRGDGTSAPEQTDDWGFPIRPADLSENWNFNGGGSVEDIYMRLRTGLDGTPMPSQSDAIEAEFITEEQLWRTAQYVRSLSPEEPPAVRDVIRAARIEGNLPAAPQDAAWEQAEPYYVPLVGQIIVKPRWFAPAVDGIWVQALHNGESLAVKLTWHDQTASPDADWDIYFQGVVQAMTDVDGPHMSEQGPDRMGVQFPLRLTEGLELPYFLAGGSQRPVYALQWTSSPDEIHEGTAAGLGTFSASSGASELTHAAAFADGEWQLTFTRPLAPVDSTQALTLVTGRPIPIGFFAADGTSGEDHIRGAVSAWYSIYLDVPTPPSVYVAPLIAALLTAALGMLVVRRAQQRERGA